MIKLTPRRCGGRPKPRDRRKGAGPRALRAARPVLRRGGYAAHRHRHRAHKSRGHAGGQPPP
jgi:hypothetical protein